MILPRQSRVHLLIRAFLNNIKKIVLLFSFEEMVVYLKLAAVNGNGTKKIKV